jgi:hypothetical protein
LLKCSEHFQHIGDDFIFHTSKQTYVPDLNCFQTLVIILVTELFANDRHDTRHYPLCEESSSPSTFINRRLRFFFNADNSPYLHNKKELSSTHCFSLIMQFSSSFLSILYVVSFFLDKFTSVSDPPIHQVIASTSSFVLGTPLDLNPTSVSVSPKFSTPRRLFTHFRSCLRGRHHQLRSTCFRQQAL